MKVLVAGAGGQLGRALVRSAPPGITVLALEHRYLDIADLNAVRGCVLSNTPDLVLNAAAFTDVERAEVATAEARSVNCHGARNLAIAAAEVGARLIHISSDFVFDGVSSVPYRPESSTNPLNKYGETKCEGELQVRRVLADRSVILRTSWLYAASGDNFLTKMLGLMHERASVRVVADQVAVPTAAQSLAKVIWRIVETPEVCGTHHWTDAGVASWYDFAVAIAEEACGLGILRDDIRVSPIETSEYATSVRRPAYSVLNTASLRKYGIEAVHWRDQLRTVLEEVRSPLLFQRARRGVHRRALEK
jgi:dTDP-4-dehydrorhamnose reductase